MPINSVDSRIPDYFSARSIASEGHINIPAIELDGLIGGTVSPFALGEVPYFGGLLGDVLGDTSAVLEIGGD